MPILIFVSSVLGKVIFGSFELGILLFWIYIIKVVYDKIPNKNEVKYKESKNELIDYNKILGNTAATNEDRFNDF